MRKNVAVVGVGTLLVTVAVASSACGAKILFGVAELPGTPDPHGDSFVVAIDESQSDVIAQARAIIDWVEAGGDPANRPDDTILVAQIVPGPDGINRNFLAPGEPLWSWHLTGDPSFAGSTIEILDGWPTFVEEDVPGWIANTNGFIGFWNYTVVTELGTVIPEPSTGVLAGAMLVGALVYLKRRSRR